MSKIKLKNKSQPLCNVEGTIREKIWTWISSQHSSPPFNEAKSWDYNNELKDQYAEFTIGKKRYVTIISYTKIVQYKDGSIQRQYNLPWVGIAIPETLCTVLGKEISKELKLEAEALRLQAKLDQVRYELARQNLELGYKEGYIKHSTGWNYAKKVLEYQLERQPETIAEGLIDPDSYIRDTATIMAKAGYSRKDKQ